jgi:hypothetical protein
MLVQIQRGIIYFRIFNRRPFSSSFYQFCTSSLRPNSDPCDSELSYFVLRMVQFGTLGCRLCVTYMLPWKRHQNDIMYRWDLSFVSGAAREPQGTIGLAVMP